MKLTDLTDLTCWRHDAWQSFTDAMIGRDYGGEALNAAWEFWKAGWEASRIAYLNKRVSSVLD